MMVIAVSIGEEFRAVASFSEAVRGQYESITPGWLWRRRCRRHCARAATIITPSLFHYV